MVENKDDIINKVNNILDKNQILEDYKYTENGYNINVNINCEIDVSHIHNIEDTFLKLVDKENSDLIFDDERYDREEGDETYSKRYSEWERNYIGIKLHEIKKNELWKYDIDVTYLLDDKKGIFKSSLEVKDNFIAVLKGDCDEYQINKLIEQCIKINSLGFSVTLVYSEEINRKIYAEFYE